MSLLLIFDFFLFFYFASIKNIRNKCNSIIDLSKFTFNKKVLSEFVILVYNQVY